MFAKLSVVLAILHLNVIVYHFTFILKFTRFKNEELKQREESQLILETQYKERLIVSREEDIQRLLSEEKFYKTSAEETQKTVFTEESYQKKKLKLKNKKNELGLWAKELKELSEKFENEHKQKILDFQAKSRILNENEQKLLNEKSKSLSCKSCCV